MKRLEMSNSKYQEWEMLVGLEVHVELNTRSKLFSSASNKFGEEPNTNISVVCTGQPGVLPVLNKEVVHKAVLLGCALNADISLLSHFDRKSYFYPDSPRNFQITQFEAPIIKNGTLTTFVNGQEKKFYISQAHIEDDAGMLKHFNSFAGVDYNRAGVPLIEIVSTPCMFSSEDAVAYATALKSLLSYINISDCNMEEGSLRFDANISVRPRGSKGLRNKVEIKNLNSFTFLSMALDYEANKQIEAYISNPNQPFDKVVPQATFRWDTEKKRTVLMRLKESAADYRYFREPDLPSIRLTQAYIEKMRSLLPELPYQKLNRYIKDMNLPRDTAEILVEDRALATFFEEAQKTCLNLKSLANWIIVEFGGRFKQAKTNLINSGISARSIADLVNMIDQGIITGKIAKTFADIMVEDPTQSPDIILKNNPDILPLSDNEFIETVIEDVLNNNLASVTDYKNGKTKALAFLIGQVMKMTKGKAPPKIVNDLLLKKLQ